MYVTPKPDNSFDKYDEEHLHMEALYNIKLVQHDLPMRILLPLERSGIVTIGDLVNCTRERLMQVRNLGALGIKRIEDYLEFMDLELKKE